MNFHEKSQGPSLQNGCEFVSWREERALYLMLFNFSFYNSPKTILKTLFKYALATEPFIWNKIT